MNIQEDVEFDSHLYPSYLTCYNGEEYAMQSSTHDALKFESFYVADGYLDIAEHNFGHLYDYSVVEFDNKILGRYECKYVIK